MVADVRFVPGTDVPTVVPQPHSARSAVRLEAAINAALVSSTRTSPYPDEARRPLCAVTTLQLLERERELARLATALAAASAGQGCIALVSGEAGIGKTSFVEHFVGAQARAALVLKGHCDAFFSLGRICHCSRVITQRQTHLSF
jgi:hypothetical protein